MYNFTNFHKQYMPVLPPLERRNKIEPQFLQSFLVLPVIVCRKAPQCKGSCLLSLSIYHALQGVQLLPSFSSQTFAQGRSLSPQYWETSTLSLLGQVQTLSFQPCSAAVNATSESASEDPQLTYEFLLFLELVFSSSSSCANNFHSDIIL